MEKHYNSNVINDAKEILQDICKTPEEKELFLRWYSIAEPILLHEEYQKRKMMEHHPNLSVFSHCLIDSFLVFLKALRKRSENFIAQNAAIAGLLHDFYTHAWRLSDDVIELGTPYCDLVYPNPVHISNVFEKHAFTHPIESLENSRIYFPELLNERIEDSILYHMYPLTRPLLRYPKYPEGRMLTWVDKTASTGAIKNSNELKKFMGISRSR